MEKVELVKKLELKQGRRYMIFMADVPPADAFEFNKMLKQLGFNAFLVTAQAEQINSLQVIEDANSKDTEVVS